jgi:hypothetical protein
MEKYFLKKLTVPSVQAYYCTVAQTDQYFSEDKMIKIEVTDPALLSDRELKSLGEFFNSLAGIAAPEREAVSYLSMPIPTNLVASHTHARIDQIITSQVESVAKAIDNDDNPGTGAETEEDKAFREMAKAFGGTGIGGETESIPKSSAIPHPAWPFPTLASSLTAAPLAAPVPNAGNADLDAAGLPWDGRIHSSGKKKNKGDELWTAKRGVPPALVVAVETELRALMALPNVGGNIPSIPVPGVAATTSAAIRLPAEVPVPGLVAAALPLPNSVTTFAQLAPRVMSATAQGTFTHADVAAACKACGLPNFPSLAAREDYVPAVFKLLFPNG